MKRVILITAAIYALLLIIYLSIYDWDPSIFVVAGENFTTPDAGVHIHPLNGYDGQFYYRLAVDPSARHDVGIRLDNPPYRQQRILYPALAWLSGHVIPVPWAMLFINYLSLIAVAYLGALHAIRSGRSPWVGLFIALWPGFAISLTRDLTEPLAVALLLAALLFIKRPLFAALLLSLAILTRETTLLVTLVLPFPFLFLPIAIYGTWQAFLWLRWGQFPALAGSGTLAWPPYVLSHGPWIVVVFIAIFALLVLFSRPSRLKSVWAGYLVLMLLASGWVWAEHYAYLRAMIEFYVIGVLIVMQESPQVVPQIFSTKVRSFLTKVNFYDTIVNGWQE